VSVHQLLHTLSYGDAISGEVLALQRALQSQNITGEIFALNVHPRYKSTAVAIGNELHFGEAIKQGDTLVLHYSLGSPLNEYFINLKGHKKVLIYHNITPARWFAAINSRVAKDITEGIKDLVPMCKAADIVIADSEFNQSELLALGISSRLLELPLDPMRWNKPSNTGISELLKAGDTVEVLHVGRLAPNKCIEDVLKTFYFFHHYVEKNSRLWLVGIDIDTEIYSFALKRLTYELGLEESVRFTGAVADEELKSFYEGADLYLCMSEHEGFCLPVVEALHFEALVFAFNAGALPRTLGGAGVLFSQKRFAALAEVMGEVWKDKELRTRMVAAGKQRVAELSYEKFAGEVGVIFKTELG
jgi:L-malate glycosyltransferase